jgi:hypothetical protein
MMKLLLREVLSSRLGSKYVWNVPKHQAQAEYAVLACPIEGYKGGN